MSLRSDVPLNDEDALAFLLEGCTPDAQEFITIVFNAARMMGKSIPEAAIEVGKKVAALAGLDLTEEDVEFLYSLSLIKDVRIGDKCAEAFITARMQGKDTGEAGRGL